MHYYEYWLWPWRPAWFFDHGITGSQDHRITGSQDHRITGSQDHEDWGLDRALRLECRGAGLSRVDCYESFSQKFAPGTEPMVRNHLRIRTSSSLAKWPQTLVISQASLVALVERPVRCSHDLLAPSHCHNRARIRSPVQPLQRTLQ